jgi:xanthosine utilization system XapX-like protein
MFAASGEKVTPFIRTQLGGQKVKITVFFTSATLIVSGALPTGRKFN